MAFRSLTDSFSFLRSNAVQNRQYFSDQNSSDRIKLVSKPKDKDVESAQGSASSMEWEKLVISVQYTFTLIRQKVKELIALHDRHLMATNLDDNLDEDQEIQRQTKELTEIFSFSHRQLSLLSAHKRRIAHQQEKQSRKLSENILSNLARTLQELSLTFRKSQSQYLNKLKTRDERIKGYLSLAPIDDYNSTVSTDFDETEYRLWEAQKQRKNYALEENTKMVVQREEEINEIVRSMHELNEIFNDVARMVVDQGTLVDRIDYNVEHTQVRVEEGLKQLTKAKRYQSKDRKIIVIMILALLVVVFGLILIVTKMG